MDKENPGVPGVTRFGYRRSLRVRNGESTVAGVAVGAGVRAKDSVSLAPHATPDPHRIPGAGAAPPPPAGAPAATAAGTATTTNTAAAEPVRSSTPPRADQGLKTLLHTAPMEPPNGPPARIAELSAEFRVPDDVLALMVLHNKDRYNVQVKEHQRKELARLVRRTYEKTIPDILSKCRDAEATLLDELQRIEMVNMALRGQQGSLAKALTESKKNFDRVEHQLRLSNATCHEHLTKAKEYDRTISTLQGMVRVATEAKERSVRENEAIKQAIRENDVVQKQLERHLSTVQAELDARQQQIVDTEKKCLAEMETKLADQASRFQHEKHTLIANHNDETSAKDNLVQVATSKVDGLQAAKDKLERHVGECRAKLEAAAEKYRGLQSILKTREESCERFSKQCAELARALESERLQNAEKDRQLEQGFRILESTRKSIDQENQALVAEKTKLAERLADRERHLQTCQHERADAARRVAELTSALETLQTQFHAVSAHRDSLAEENASRATSTIKLETELQVVKDMHERTVTQLSQLRDDHSRVTEKIKVERVFLESDAARLKDEKAAALQTLECELQLLTERNSHNEELLKSRTSELEEALTELKVLKEAGPGHTDDEHVEKILGLQLEADQLRRQLQCSSQIAGSMEDLQTRYSRLEERFFESEMTRRKLHNQVQDLRGNVRVFVRVRPSTNGAETPIVCQDEENLVVGESRFRFDRVFAAQSTQTDVFGHVSDFIQSALDGYNVCLFSYGQTGSGKTFTMEGEGDGSERGLIPRSAEKIMETSARLRASGWEFQISASFAEIYNEELRDLLLPAGSKQRPELAIKLNSQGRPQVTGLVAEQIDRIDRIHQLMGLASKNRAVAATQMNARSSRSHSIFILRVRGINEARKITLSGSLNLCDLAGSERLARSNATGERLKETQSINKSLSALVDVFDALKKKNSHVPYRNSKLTYLLQECLSGDGKAVMFVNLSPEAHSVSETVCSLKFAAQVNQTELGRAKRQMENGHSSRLSTVSSSSNGSRVPTSPARSTSSRLARLAKPR